MNKSDFNPTLRELTEKPFKHISDILECLEHCVSKEEVDAVIDLIPRKFGHCYAIFREDDVSFTFYYDDGDFGEEAVDFELWIPDANDLEPDPEVQQSWLSQMYQREIDEMNGTLDNERIWLAGAERQGNEEAIACHKQNIVNIHEYLRTLADLLKGVE